MPWSTATDWLGGAALAAASQWEAASAPAASPPLPRDDDNAGAPISMDGASSSLPPSPSSLSLCCLSFRADRRV